MKKKKKKNYTKKKKREMQKEGNTILNYIKPNSTIGNNNATGINNNSNNSSSNPVIISGKEDANTLLKGINDKMESLVKKTQTSTKKNYNYNSKGKIRHRIAQAKKRRMIFKYRIQKKKRRNKQKSTEKEYSTLYFKKDKAILIDLKDEQKWVIIPKKFYYFQYKDAIAASERKNMIKKKANAENAINSLFKDSQDQSQQKQSQEPEQTDYDISKAAKSVSLIGSQKVKYRKEKTRVTKADRKQVTKRELNWRNKRVMLKELTQSIDGLVVTEGVGTPFIFYKRIDRTQYKVQSLSSSFSAELSMDVQTEIESIKAVYLICYKHYLRHDEQTNEPTNAILENKQFTKENLKDPSILFYLILSPKDEELKKNKKLVRDGKDIITYFNPQLRANYSQFYQPAFTIVCSRDKGNSLFVNGNAQVTLYGSIDYLMQMKILK